MNTDGTQAPAADDTPAVNQVCTCPAGAYQFNSENMHPAVFVVHANNKLGPSGLVATFPDGKLRWRECTSSEMVNKVRGCLLDSMTAHMYKYVHHMKANWCKVPAVCAASLHPAGKYADMDVWMVPRAVTMFLLLYRIVVDIYLRHAIQMQQSCRRPSRL